MGGRRECSGGGGVLDESIEMLGCGFGGCLDGMGDLGGREAGLGGEVCFLELLCVWDEVIYQLFPYRRRRELWVMLSGGQTVEGRKEGRGAKGVLW